MRGTTSAGRRRTAAPYGSGPGRGTRSDCTPSRDDLPRFCAATTERTPVAEDTLTITDNRTGREYTLPINDGTIRATDLRQIAGGEDDTGLLSYDPAYLNTASCRSAITYI